MRLVTAEVLRDFNLNGVKYYPGSKITADESVIISLGTAVDYSARYNVSYIDAVVQNNTARSYAANKTIRVETGSTGYVVTDNQVTHSILDTPAVGVRVANNDIIV